jgi:predicted MFS family arabinose efflux permease
MDTVSYLVSALSLKGIVAAEQPPTSAQRRSVWAEIGEGIRELVRTPVLRALAVAISIGTFGLAVQETVLLLYFTRNLGFTPAIIGGIYAIGGVGALAGAVVASRVAQRVGVGRAIVLGNLLWALGVLLIPFVADNIVLIGTGQIVAHLGAIIWSVNQMSLRQQITPVGLFARATAARRVLMYSLQMTGALLGGVLGTAIGLLPTLVLGAFGLFVGFLLTFFSPVRTATVSGERT